MEYTGQTFTPTADVTTFKILENSVISNTNAKFIDADIKHFYLNKIMNDPEYMLIPLKCFPPDIIEQFDLKKRKTGWC